MADVIQAAKWAQEGKKVRCASKAGQSTGFPQDRLVKPTFAEYMIADEHGRLRSEDGLYVPFTTNALLATDWEIVP